MIRKTIYFSALHVILYVMVGLSSCVTTKTAIVTDQDDDVYYSVAQAKEASPVVYANESIVKDQDYVTEDELYGDRYNGLGYGTDYTSRFNRFRYFSPFLGYYNSLYGFNYYDPFFNGAYYPFNSYWNGSFVGLNLSFGSGFYNNPWGYYGFGYGSSFWGPYSYLNSWNPYLTRGGLYNRGYYSGIYSSPAFSAPNYRSRPNRGVDNLGIDRGSVIPNPRGVIIKDTNGNVIQSRGRAERYGDEVPNNPSGNRTTTSRPQSVTRPERVNQAPPQRVSQPERIYSAPRQDNGSSSRGSSSSPSNGGGSSGGARPSRGN